MHLLKMKGAWGGWSSRLYTTVVARGCGQLYEQFVRQALPPLNDGAKVVDVGCGEGQVTCLIARLNPASQVLGLDLAQEMVRRARRLSQGMTNIRFERGDALDLPLADGSVDLVVSVASIKHWPDQLAGLTEIRRVLRSPGGVVCLLEVERDCSRQAVRKFVRYWRYVIPGTHGLLGAYFRRIVAGQGLTQDELRALMQRAGFQGVECDRVQDLPFVVARGRT